MQRSQGAVRVTGRIDELGDLVREMRRLTAHQCLLPRFWPSILWDGRMSFTGNLDLLLVGPLLPWINK